MRWIMPGHLLCGPPRSRRSIHRRFIRLSALSFCSGSPQGLGPHIPQGDSRCWWWWWCSA
ncbi:hypothetical protein BD289DRAFT_447743 [Coniella lustricola]|uniref:Uncharacterized protein n=1 Tax=Coniella lustricola TaxID=2025994 RepID=A0A2T2ZST0_9PEZI|nr:hypothetical protein BD289DRAFT_447743 [Coniella lustricola]